MGFTPKYNDPTPTAPVNTANKTAARLETSFLTNGLFLVLDIFASVDDSYSIFNAFALAMQSAVPVVRKKSVSGDSDGATVAEEERIAGTGYRA